MKRSNPQTGKIFKCGEYRDDGFRFHHYRYDRPLKDGLYTEAWYSPEAYENQIIGMAKCRESNREKARQTTRVWQINNPDKVNAYFNQRRADKLNRTPSWLSEDQRNEIQEFYEMAKALENIFPWKQHVDHIVPLKGKNVSGLNVPWNLQILSAHGNITKSNKY